MIVQAPRVETPILKALIDRLTVSLEIIAFGSNLQSEYTSESQQPVPYPALRDVLWSGQADTSKEPFIVEEDASQHDGEPFSSILWKLPVFLSEYKRTNHTL